jgi:hypothetical protein
MNEVIVPAYNPVMLEKMDAKQLFIRAGFAELFLRETLDSSKASNDADVSTFVQLAAITQGVDSVLSKASTFITCKNNWEYFGVYYGAETEGELLSGNTFGLSIVTDDEDASAMLRATPMSNIIVRNVLDYIKTFPAELMVLILLSLVRQTCSILYQLFILLQNTLMTTAQQLQSISSLSVSTAKRTPRLICGNGLIAISARRNL